MPSSDVGAGAWLMSGRAAAAPPAVARQMKRTPTKVTHLDGNGIPNTTRNQYATGSSVVPPVPRGAEGATISDAAEGRWQEAVRRIVLRTSGERATQPATLSCREIGAPGFEPGTSPIRTVRATRLRHAPKGTQSSRGREARDRRLPDLAPLD